MQLSRQTLGPVESTMLLPSEFVVLMLNLLLVCVRVTNVLELLLLVENLF